MGLTKSMKKYLESLPKTESGSLMPLNNTPDEKSKFLIYMKRLQQTIEQDFDAIKYLSVNYPDILLNEDNKYLNSKIQKKPNRRMKSLYEAIMTLNPKVELELIRKDVTSQNQNVAT